VIGRVTVLVLACLGAFVVGYIDTAPIWVLLVLACLSVGVYLVFLAVSNRRPKPAKSCSCPTCRAPRQYAAAHIEQVWP
jgi:hypothetical protein